MIKKFLFAAALCLAYSQAHAGIWDTITGFFGGDKEEAVVQPAATEDNATSSAAMVKKGIELIPLLTQTLGVTQGQAQGGLGSILQAAQVLLSGSDFGTLLSGIPNANSLLSAAPKIEQVANAEGGDLLNSALSKAAEHSETAKTAGQLLSQFKALGLGADMIPKFTETTKTYLQQSEKTEASDLISQVGKLF